MLTEPHRSANNSPSENGASRSKNRLFIEHIFKDSNLKKNRGNNLRLSQNPLVEDLISAQERAIKIEK